MSTNDVYPVPQPLLPLVLVKNHGWKRVHLWDRKIGVGLDVGILRDAAVAIASEFCGVSLGPDRETKLGDPLFDLVTEGRAPWKDYSACGDLCHAVLRCLGCTDEKVVNRSDDGGQRPWRMGKNLSMLVYDSGKAWIRANDRYTLDDERRSALPRKGDIAMIEFTEAERAKRGWDGAHVFVCAEDVQANLDRDMVSYDYGQVIDGKPGGKWVERSLMYGNGRFRTVLVGKGERRLQGFLSLPRLNYSESAVVPPWFTLGVVDDNPYYEQVTGV